MVFYHCVINHYKVNGLNNTSLLTYSSLGVTWLGSFFRVLVEIKVDADGSGRDTWEKPYFKLKLVVGLQFVELTFLLASTWESWVGLSSEGREI